MSKVKIVVSGRAIVSYKGEVFIDVPDEITDEDVVREGISGYVYCCMSEQLLIQSPTTKFIDLESKQMEWEYAKCI